ncbi:hypothetical protein A3A95_03775 [Candidatus Nomurabacteria bacterium RIFCSPLOWO2_01_FULL_39_18]|uniref:Uncharacterized protein n=1 Tax=Candidatus Nomurabacteria bacterium RIFCSPHIGHO2_01_FULL_40_24b TaxID=1801739 RepID=A0A1F6V6D6_9BACT|nr:MAG: hypothetical protein A2647_04745 [Candidatus Nomurabacteria bacterium RIFCSPHIGHO2_01_FULL_40_24b]OGI89225.1 MAG: hypothetical protein A3A95_03775 [Candidatus Nomurabacteria bacterium RIFCSPLOWO2_01_FULL_39_18]
MQKTEIRKWRIKKKTKYARIVKRISSLNRMIFLFMKRCGYRRRPFARSADFKEDYCSEIIGFFIGESALYVINQY